MKSKINAGLRLYNARKQWLGAEGAKRHRELQERLLECKRNVFDPEAQFRAAETEQGLDLYIYGGLDAIFGVGAEDVIQAIDGRDDIPLNVYINSLGGSVFEAVAITSVLGRHRGQVTVTVDGIAASAATFLLTAADRSFIHPMAQIMIHQAGAFAFGTAEDMEAMAGLLQQADDIIVAAYARLTGIDEDEIRSLMAAETFFTAEQAVERGFVDEIAEGRVQPDIDGQGDEAEGEDEDEDKPSNSSQKFFHSVKDILKIGG